MRFSTIFAAICGLALATTASAADNPEKIFKEVLELIQAGDTEAALEEAKWGVERLEQIRQDKVSDVFPDEINKMKAGPLNKNKAMGVSVTERTYSHDGMSVSVTLTEGSSAGALGGLGALAQMAGAFGGGRKVRIQRRTGTAMSEGRNSTVTVGLESGGTLMFQSNDMDMDALIEFAEGFPVAKIDEARS